MTDNMNAAATAPLSDNLGRSSPGEYLRRLREEKGHTHATVSTALHLTVHYIKALEGDEYGKLPGLTFVKGYLRSYARFLGADVNTVLARFDEHITGLLDAGQHTARVERSKRRQDQALRWAIGAGLVAVAGIAAGWWFMRDAQPADDAAPRAAALASQQTNDATLPAQTPSAAASTARVADDPFAAVSRSNAFEQDAVVAQGNAVAPAVMAPEALAAGVSEGAAEDEFMPSLVSEENEFGSSSPVAGIAVAGTNVAEQGTFDAAADVAASNTAAASTATIPAATATSTAATSTVAPSTESSPAPAATGVRQISLMGAGNDELRLGLKGNSWVEVSDGSSTRLFSDTLGAGDSLAIRGQGPFRVVLGDAANVDISLNAQPVDISADIRADRTARVQLGAPASAPQPATTSAAPGASAPAEATEVTQ